ncbi:MAG: protein translocase subunit SecF [Firmicutes bacterium]|nr:protein translocase subunit SecF [Bacillota bacterium]
MKHREFHFDIVGKRKIWYIIALAVIIPGLLICIFSGLNLGIDFTGGNILEVSYQSDVNLADVRDTVGKFVDQTPAVNQGEGSQFLIKTEEMEENESQALRDALSQLGQDMTVLRSGRIGPVIGSELLSNARWALLLAAILMLAYITFRFRFHNAITAIVALLHDVMIIISIFAIFRIEVDSAFIAIILTILGYSINNTIVIFDRIRENDKYGGQKNFPELVNLSINQTLNRTINTSIAVLILLLCMLFLGGVTTRTFIFGLTIGIVAGFYSSVFLVGPILVELHNHSKSAAKKKPVPVKNKVAKNSK